MKKNSELQAYKAKNRRCKEKFTRKTLLEKVYKQFSHSLNYPMSNIFAFNQLFHLVEIRKKDLV